jgi:hypothetical protein
MQHPCGGFVPLGTREAVLLCKYHNLAVGVGKRWLIRVSTEQDDGGTWLSFTNTRDGYILVHVCYLLGPTCRQVPKADLRLNT